MRVVVVSDTHGSLKAWSRIVEIVGEDNLFLHLGDVLYHGPRNPIPEGYNPKALAEELKRYRVEYVRGNCDADVDVMVLGLAEMPRVSIDTFGGWKIVMVHGDDVDDPVGLAREHGAHVVMLGHTHVPVLSVSEGVLILNPGSPSLPKGGYPPTFAIVGFSSKSVEARILSLEGEELMKEVLER